MKDYTRVFGPCYDDSLYYITRAFYIKGMQHTHQHDICFLNILDLTESLRECQCDLNYTVISLLPTHISWLIINSCLVVLWKYIFTNVITKRRNRIHKVLLIKLTCC